MLERRILLLNESIQPLEDRMLHQVYSCLFLRLWNDSLAQTPTLPSALDLSCQTGCSWRDGVIALINVGLCSWLSPMGRLKKQAGERSCIYFALSRSGPDKFHP